jgi:hypothetical protein
LGSLYQDSVRVVIPESYIEVNNEINKSSDNSRILVLPLINGDSMIYDWGFAGVEPSEFLFDKPTISKLVPSEPYASKYNQIMEAINKGDNLDKLFNELNVKYILIHKDIIKEYEEVYKINPEDVENKIINTPRTSKIYDSQDLVLYNYQGDNENDIILNGNGDYSYSAMRLSPTKVAVSVEGECSDCTIIFKETFNKNWRAYYGNEELKIHSEIYGYANEWKLSGIKNGKVNLVLKIL